MDSQQGFQILFKLVAEVELGMFGCMGDYDGLFEYREFFFFPASWVEKLAVLLVSLDDFLSSYDIKTVALCASFSLSTVSKLTRF